MTDNIVTVVFFLTIASVLVHEAESLLRRRTVISSDSEQSGVSTAIIFGVIGGGLFIVLCCILPLSIRYCKSRQKTTTTAVNADANTAEMGAWTKDGSNKGLTYSIPVPIACPDTDPWMGQGDDNVQNQAKEDASAKVCSPEPPIPYHSPTAPLQQGTRYLDAAADPATARESAFHRKDPPTGVYTELPFASAREPRLVMPPLDTGPYRQRPVVYFNKNVRSAAKSKPPKHVMPVRKINHM